MKGMRVTILGCGGSAGVPQLGGSDGKGDWGQCDPAEPRNRRSRSSIVIEHQADGQMHRLLIDTSPDLRRQMIDCEIPWIDSVLYTHPHADHIAGFDELRIVNRIIQKPIGLYATDEALDQLKSRFEYAFKPWNPPYYYCPVLTPNRIAFDDNVTIDGLTLRLFEQDHGSIRSVGFRIGGFGYSTDVVALDERALDILQGVDVWVVDCFQRKPLKTHAHPEKVCEWIDRLRPKRVILTHMGFDMDWAWMQANLAPAMEPAFDGMVLDFALDQT